MTHTFPLTQEDVAACKGNILQHSAFREPSAWALVKELIRPKPRMLDCIQVEVTSHCGARCSYCPHTTEADTWRGHHMDARTFANLWPLLRKSHRIHLQGWGEPLLHPHFFDFVAFARKADCRVSSTSCALHISEDVALRLVRSGIDIMAFSLAGTDDVSNAVRHGADFHKVCDNIRRLETLRKKKLAVHMEIHVAYLLLADRMEAVLHLPRLLHDLGISTAIISTLDYVPSPQLQALALTPDNTEALARAQSILHKAQQLAATYNVQLHYALPSRTSATACRENIQKSLYVSAAGTLSPCVYLNIPSAHADCTAHFGHVNTENALHIWHKHAFAHFRDRHGANAPTHALCHNCVKRYEALSSL